MAKDTIIFFKLCTHTLIFHWYQITTGTINNICYFTSALIQKSLFYTRSAIIKQYFIGFSWQYILQQKPNYCRNPNSYLHLSAIQSLNYLLPFLSSNHTPLFYKLRKVVMLHNYYVNHLLTTRENRWKYSVSACCTFKLQTVRKLSNNDKML